MGEEKIIRLRQGDPVPEPWIFKQWLGTEGNIIHGPPHYRADVLLVERTNGPEESDAQ